MPVFVSPESGESRSIFDWLRGIRQPTPEGYLRVMTLLELLWREVVPGLSFQVVHDEPDQLPGRSTRTAMTTFAALRQNPHALKWFVKHIRNAVVHCVPAADAISIVDDSMHFYEVKKFPNDLGTRLFDRLSSKQQQDFAQLCPGQDPRQAFADFIGSVQLTDPDEVNVFQLYEQLIRHLHPHSLILLARAREANPSAGNGSADGAWSDEINERRIELIDRDIQGELTEEERNELAELQRQAVAYRDRVAPLPIEGARRLHEQLLERKRQQEAT